MWLTIPNWIFTFFLLFFSLFNILPVCFSSQQEAVVYVHQARFAKSFKDQEMELFLKGAGLNRFLLAEICAAGLYVDDVSMDLDRILQNAPKRLEVVYLQKIDGKHLATATRRGIAANVSREDYQLLKEPIEQMNKFYQTVNPGDRYSLTYWPNRGTEVRLNDELKGVIEGQEFASAFFSIWIGQNPYDKRLKEALLGNLPLQELVELKHKQEPQI